MQISDSHSDPIPQDAVIVFGYAGLWLLSAILNTAYAGVNSNVLLGISAVSNDACEGGISCT